MKPNGLQICDGRDSVICQFLQALTLINVVKIVRLANFYFFLRRLASRPANVQARVASGAFQSATSFPVAIICISERS